MNIKLLLDDYDKKQFYFHDFYGNKPFTSHESKTDLDNTTVTYNIDGKNIVLNIYTLAYIYVKKKKLKFYWSWNNLNMNNNNNNEIKKLFDYGLKINNINNNFIDNIKYYLINNSFYINNIYELDIIIAISLYILNCDYMLTKNTNKKIQTIYIFKKSK